MFLKLEASKSGIFTTMIEIVSSVIDDVNIEFTSERFYIQSMDSSRISLIELSVGNGWFTEYNSKQGITIGIKLQRKEIIQCFLKMVL